MTTLTKPRPQAAVREGAAGSLTGTGTLVRFLLRRDRRRLAAWTLGLALGTLGSVASLTQTYPTAAERQTIAETTASPAMVAMVGVNHSPGDYHFGAMLGHQMLWSTTLLVALMSVLLVVRHTRAEEAAGRAELVRAGVTGRHAPVAAALVVAGIANVLVAAALAVGLTSLGLEGVTPSGSILYGAAHAAVGLVFAGVAAVTVQITEHPRGASGLALAVLGGAYLLRGIGDVGNGVLSWLSPIGWAQATRVYVNDRWWPLLLALVTGTLLVALAVTLSTRRDVGAGLRAPKPGTAHASAILGNPFGLALRLQRASLIAWSAGLFLLGLSYGSVLGEAERWLSEVDAMADLLPDITGVGVTETFAAMVMTIMAIFASVYAVLAAQKARSEEAAGRAEPVLATGVSRTRWVTTHLAIAVAGGLVVLLSAGLGLGLAGASSTGDGSLLPRLLAAALGYAPALWVIIGAAVLLYGLAPRATAAVWFLVGYAFVVVYLGGLLRLPGWLTNLSPFGHVPQQPAEAFSVPPLLALTLVAAGLIGAGLYAFRQRDLHSPA